jgi:translation initiation factor 2-alpha kinase 4
MGLNIVRELWAAGISAEVAIDTRAPDELTAYYKDDKHNWIVMIKQETGGSGERVLKVRNMIRKEDAEIRSSELLGWLRGEIRDRNQRDGTQQRAHLFRAASLPETSQPWSEHDPDVRVLFSQHKGKKNNRRSVVEAGK